MIYLRLKPDIQNVAMCLQICVLFELQNVVAIPFMCACFVVA